MSRIPQSVSSSLFILRRARKRVRGSGLLAFFVLLSMWGNLAAAVLCPHMNGKTERCLIESSPHDRHPHPAGMPLSPAPVSAMDHAGMPHMDMDDMQMGGMDMSSMDAASPDLSLMEPLESEPDHAVQIDAGAVSAAVLSAESALNSTANSVAFTTPSGDCAHCSMHSQSGAAVSVSVISQSRNSQQVVAGEVAAEPVAISHVNSSLLDLHDHGPPAFAGPRYVLINVFRI